jgi:hypothetical protein
MRAVEVPAPPPPRRTKVAAPDWVPGLGGLAAAVAAALPLLVLAVALLAQHPTIAAYGDRAVVGLETRDFIAGRQWIGPYSRFGWHHPGPAFFIPLALASVVLRNGSWALDAGILAAGLVCLVATVEVVRRAAGWVPAVAAAGVCGFYVRAVGPALLRDPWNPWAVLLPLILLMALTGAASAGSVVALAWALLVTTLVVQTHVGAAPLAVTLLVTAAILWSTDGWRSEEWRRPAAIIPLAVTVLLWVPPLAQEAAGPSRNLTALARFFLTTDGSRSSPLGHGTRQSLMTAVATVGRRLAQVPFGASAGVAATQRPTTGWEAARNPALVILAWLAAGLVLFAVGRRQGNRFAAGLGVLTVLALPAAILAVHGVQGDLQGYLIGWIGTIPVGAALGACGLLPSSRRGVATAVAVAVVGCGVGTAAAVHAPPARQESVAQVTTTWQGLQPQLAGRRPTTVALDIEDPTAWPIAAGLALELAGAGWRVHVAPLWEFMFGTDRADTGRERVVIDVIGSLPGPITTQVTTRSPR